MDVSGERGGGKKSAEADLLLPGPPPPSYTFPLLFFATIQIEFGQNFPLSLSLYFSAASYFAAPRRNI